MCRGEVWCPEAEPKDTEAPRDANGEDAAVPQEPVWPGLAWQQHQAQLAQLPVLRPLRAVVLEVVLGSVGLSSLSERLRARQAARGAAAGAPAGASASQPAAAGAQQQLPGGGRAGAAGGEDAV